MVKKVIWLTVSCFMVISLMFASCSTTTTETKTEEDEDEDEDKVIITETEIGDTEKEEEVQEEVMTGPQYGGTFTTRLATDPLAFDPYLTFGPGLSGMHYENLGMGNFMGYPTSKVDDVDWRGRFWPVKYHTGMLAESWETSDMQNIIFHIRKGVHWHDLYPVNGREFNAYDVEFSYQRLLGLGYGYTQEVPHAKTGLFVIDSVTALDEYTLQFKFKSPSWDQFRDITYDLQTNNIVPREAVELWGDVNEWDHTIGTGPFIMDDYVTGSCITHVRNPNYWDYDERYPENQLPYFDTVKTFIILDSSTALAGLRTGKIDRLEMVDWEDVAQLQKISPSLVATPNFPQGIAIWMRADNEYFDDIRVRSAMQMAIDLETIAETYYGGFATGEPSGPVGHPGWKTNYSAWPQELKDRYEYNPEGAKELLAQAGYPEGFKVKLVVSTAQDVDLMHVIQDMVSKINVDIEVQPMESGSWLSYVTGGHATDMSYSLRGVHSNIPAPAIIRYYTSHHTHSPAHNHSDEHINELYAKMEVETDEIALMKLIQEADLYCASQQWQIVLPTTQTYLIEQPWVKGRDCPLQGVIQQGQKYARWWIDQQLKTSMGY